MPFAFKELFRPDPSGDNTLEWVMRQFWRISNNLELVTEKLEAGGWTQAPLWDGRTATLGEFTSIPSAANQILIAVSNLSTVGTGVIDLELGHAGGYAGATGTVYTGPVSVTGKININPGTPLASDGFYGRIEMTKIEGINNWIITGYLLQLNAPVSRREVVGYIVTTSPADRIKITVAADTFDFGKASVFYYA